MAKLLAPRTPISFGSDNHSGIHPQILKALIETNAGHAPAYGTDDVTAETNILIQSLFGKSCDPYFVFNGTAANVLAISSLIESHEAIITASTAHLQMDECGAPEKIIGCKVLTAPSEDGKITPEGISKFLIRGGDQHYAQPKLVSITLPSEYGTCYSREELDELRQFTREKKLYLHIDGARFIYAPHFLKCELIDLSEKLGVDAISFGGTKNGLLFGEMVLLYNEAAKKKFKYIRKQNMQLPSKMRFLAAQFRELLKPPGLWREIVSRNHEMALYLARGLKAFSQVTITQNVEANSVFVKIPRPWYKNLREFFFFYIWDEECFEARLMISYDVTKTDIDRFLALISDLNETEY